MPDRKSGMQKKCPTCGEDVEEDTLTCPTCGSFIDRLGYGKRETVEEEAAEDVEDSKQLSLCPNCGSFVSEKAERCLLCGLSFKDYKPKSLKDIENVPPMEEKKGALFMCPECGAFLSESATVCPICKAEVANEEDVEEEAATLAEAEEEVDEEMSVVPAEEIDEETDEVSEEEEAEVRVCDVCHSNIPIDSMRCYICGSKLDEPAVPKAKEELKEVEEPEVSEVAEDLSLETVCPECGTEIGEGETICAKCGTELAKESIDTVEDDIDEFFEELKEIEPSRSVSVQPEALSEDFKAVEAKVKKPAELSTEPSTKVRVIGLKPGRKFEFLLYAAIITLLVHYFGVQSGLQNIQYAVTFLYGALFVIGVALVFNLRILKKFSRRFTKKLIIPISGYIVVISIPSRWFFTGHGMIDIIILIVGLVLAIVGLITTTAWRSTGASINMNLICGTLLLFLVSIYIILQPMVGSNVEVLAVGLGGASLIIFGFVLTILKKTSLPIEFPIEERPIKTYDARRKDMEPRRIYGNDVPWYSKASALMLLDRYEEALECADVAIDINPKNEIAWVIKGNSLSRLNRQVDALKAFNTAIKLNPMYEVAWNNKGNALSRMKNYDEALRCYDEAIKLRPDYREAWVNKGYVLAKLGKYKDAANCADKVISITPKARAGV